MAPLTFADFPLRDQPVRFAAGDPSKLTSNSWRIWREKRGDLYIACRDNYRQVKISLHTSGSWQMGFTSEAVRDEPGLLQGDQTRHWEIWPRPDPQFGGATAAFRLVFIPTELGVPESLRPRKQWQNVAFLYSEDPLLHVFTLWITDGEPMLQHESSPTKTLALFSMPDDQTAQLTFHAEPASPQFVRTVGSAHEFAQKQAEAAGLEVPIGARLLVYGHDAQDTRWLTEVWSHRDADGAPLLPADLRESDDAGQQGP